MTQEVYQMMLQVWYMLRIQPPGHCKCSLTFPPNEGTTFSLAFREQGFWAWVVVWGLVTQGLATNHPLMIGSSFSSQETSNKTKQNIFSETHPPKIIELDRDLRVPWISSHQHPGVYLNPRKDRARITIHFQIFHLPPGTIKHGNLKSPISGGILMGKSTWG